LHFHTHYVKEKEGEAPTNNSHKQWICILTVINLLELMFHRIVAIGPRLAG